MCYALYFENQDMTRSPNTSIASLNKFKPEDEPSSRKQHNENWFVPKKAGNCKAEGWV